MQCPESHRVWRLLRYFVSISSTVLTTGAKLMHAQPVCLPRRLYVKVKRRKEICKSYKTREHASKHDLPGYNLVICTKKENAMEKPI